MVPIRGIRNLLKTLEADVIASSSLKWTESHVRELIRDLRGAKSYTLSIQQECSEEFRSVYGRKSYILDYIIYLHTSLFLLCSEKFHVGESSRAMTKEPDKVSTKMNYTTLMLVHLINSLLSVRVLIEKGLDVQAKQILRSYIEYSDLALAVLADETFYDNYQRMGKGEKEEKEVWNKFTRPSALTKILKRIYINMDGTGKQWDIVQSVRKSMYGALSDYTHGHFTAVFMGAAAEDVQGEFGHIALGSITKSIDHTLVQAIVYAYSFLKHAMIAIVMYQKLPFMEFGEQGEKFVVHYKMLEFFMPAFVQSWADEQGSVANL